MELRRFSFVMILLLIALSIVLPSPLLLFKKWRPIGYRIINANIMSVGGLLIYILISGIINVVIYVILQTLNIQIHQYFIYLYFASFVLVFVGLWLGTVSDEDSSYGIIIFKTKKEDKKHKKIIK